MTGRRQDKEVFGPGPDISHGHSHSLPGENNARFINHRQAHSSIQPPLHNHIPPSVTDEPSAGLDSRIERSDSYLSPPRGTQGFPSLDTTRPRSRTVTGEEKKRELSMLKELLSAVLVPLPYILSNLVLQDGPLPVASKGILFTEKLKDSTAQHDAEIQISPSVFQFDVISTCVLCSVTLLLVGISGIQKGVAGSSDRRKPNLGHRRGTSEANVFSMDAARRISGRMLVVGLPYFATTQLGGERVALLLLIALAGNLMKTEGEPSDVTSIQGWKRLFNDRKLTVAAIVLQVISDFLGFTIDRPFSALMVGYLALGVSIFVTPFPYSTSRPKASFITSPNPTSEEKTTALATTPWEMTAMNAEARTVLIQPSPLTYTPTDTNFTLASGFILGVLALILSLFSGNRFSHFSIARVGWTILASAFAAASLVITQPQTLRGSKGTVTRGTGFAVGMVFTVASMTIFHVQSWASFSFQCLLVSGVWLAVYFDTQMTSHSFDSKVIDRNYRIKPHSAHEKHSILTSFLLQKFRHHPIIHNVLIETDSRRIFYFMCLNLAFMSVQTFYGVVTGSLGLLSDSIHMLFDCIALAVGLAASVMSRWPPSMKFPYGYGKMDTLAGFANGIFLMLISIEIVYEAIERLAAGSQMQRIGELLTVSSLGLVVNLIGMSAFGHAHHGHGHSHGGHSHAHDHHEHDHGAYEQDHNTHDHDHAHEHKHDHALNHHHAEHTHDHHGHHHRHHHDNESGDDDTLQARQYQSHLRNATLSVPSSPFLNTIPSTPSKPPPTPAVHSHGHHHGNENMHGIFLHVLADTLGSVAVVISTLLVHQTGWAGFDPLASCLIAILIFASAIPLVTSSAKRLLLTVPEATEFDLREALAGVSALKGVAGVNVPRFWVGEGEDGRVGGVMHVIAQKGFEAEDVRRRAVGWFEGRGMDVLVQVERESGAVGAIGGGGGPGGACWCGGSAVAVNSRRGSVM